MPGMPGGGNIPGMPKGFTPPGSKGAVPGAPRPQDRAKAIAKRKAEKAARKKNRR